MTRVTVGPLPSLEQLRRAFHHPLRRAALVETMRKERGRGHAHLIFAPFMTQTSLPLLFPFLPKHAHSASPPFAIFRIRLSSQQGPRARSDALLASLSSVYVHQSMRTTSSSLQHAWPQPNQRGPHRLLLAFWTNAHLSSALYINTEVGSPWNHSCGDSPVATSMRGGSV